MVEPEKPTADELARKRLARLVGPPIGADNDGVIRNSFDQDEAEGKPDRPNEDDDGESEVPRTD
jgi:hypothetical protein